MDLTGKVLVNGKEPLNKFGQFMVKLKDGQKFQETYGMSMSMVPDIWSQLTSLQLPFLCLAISSEMKENGDNDTYLDI